MASSAPCGLPAAVAANELDGGASVTSRPGDGTCNEWCGYPQHTNRAHARIRTVRRATRTHVPRARAGNGGRKQRWQVLKSVTTFRGCKAPCSVGRGRRERVCAQKGSNTIVCLRKYAIPPYCSRNPTLAQRDRLVGLQVRCACGSLWPVGGSPRAAAITLSGPARRRRSRRRRRGWSQKPPGLR